jgi:hypothetical protein
MANVGINVQIEKFIKARKRIAVNDLALDLPRFSLLTLNNIDLRMAL